MSWYDGLLEVAGGVASAALATTGPAGLAVSAVLNMFLDDDEKVTPKTPLSEVEAKYNTLNPEQQAMVSTAYYDYLKNKDVYDFKTHDSNNTRETEMLRIKELADGGDGAVRPWTVKMFVLCVCLVSMTYCISMFLVAFNALDAETVLPSWEQLSAALALPSWVIRSYFNDRSSDKENKLNASLGNPLNARESLISKTIKAFKS